MRGCLSLEGESGVCMMVDTFNLGCGLVSECLGTVNWIESSCNVSQWTT